MADDDYMDMSHPIPSYEEIGTSPDNPYETPTRSGTTGGNSHIYDSLRFWNREGRAGHISRRALIGIFVALASVVVIAIIVMIVVLTGNNNGKKAYVFFALST